MRGCETVLESHLNDPLEVRLAGKSDIHFYLRGEADGDEPHLPLHAWHFTIYISLLITEGIEPFITLIRNDGTVIGPAIVPLSLGPLHVIVPGTAGAKVHGLGI